MNNLIILQGITKEELLKDIETIFEKKLKTATQKTNEIKYLTIEETSTRLKVGRRTIHSLISRGMLTPIKAGRDSRRTFIKADEVEKLFTDRYIYRY